MRKYFFILMAVICCSSIFASTPERIERLTSKVVLLNTEGYFVLSDGSCWKAIGFSKRWRSLSEWWNNVQIAPESYNCIPNDWCLGSEIEIYSKYNNIAVSESDASNQEQLKQCTHLLFNSRTRQVLFAIALEPEDCIIRLFNDAHSEGYNLGYTQGKLDSSYNYQDGYSNGYNAGYDEGYKAGSDVIIIQNQ